ncbi:hypothetical protein E2C01_101054 [Portunus trituberculatus]|uniref:Uncharacterized protein n=1 Tax=Portunus trituberculatus TaxID=210409 RepID=A0A5B7KJ37_PORTR|nr:hypothetical protein [Portunus trituberculatus]
MCPSTEGTKESYHCLSRNTYTYSIYLLPYIDPQQAHNFPPQATTTTTTTPATCSLQTTLIYSYSPSITTQRPSPPTVTPSASSSAPGQSGAIF